MCSTLFLSNRPSFEPGFYLVRQEGRGRNIVYTIQSYAVQSAAECTLLINQKNETFQFHFVLEVIFLLNY
jgi:hypothetical protein